MTALPIIETQRCVSINVIFIRDVQIFLSTGLGFCLKSSRIHMYSGIAIFLHVSRVHTRGIVQEGDRAPYFWTWVYV